MPNAAVVGDTRSESVELIPVCIALVFLSSPVRLSSPVLAPTSEYISVKFQSAPSS
eukprot:IDg14670t1